MTRNKQSKNDALSFEDNSQRCEIADEESSASCGCRSLFGCGPKKASRVDETSLDLTCNEYDYIVEKLVIKRVPIGLFATPYDVYDGKPETATPTRRADITPESLLPVSDSPRAYPLVHAVDSSLFYTSANTERPAGFSTGSSDGILRFATNKAAFDEDAVNAATSGYSELTTIRYRDAHRVIDKLTALHPHLKESERAPKDPCPMNATRSRRSLAEEISEIAATKEISNRHCERPMNEPATTGSVRASRSGPSTEPSTLTSPEDVPTRDKADETSGRYGTGSSSCFPFSWRYESRDEETEPEPSIPRTDESAADVRDTSGPDGPSKNQNYVISPVQVHYASPNLEKIPRFMGDGKNCVDAGSRKKESSTENNEKTGRFGVSSSDGNSEASEKPRIDNPAGTTLRWKIIIKHRPPGSPTPSGGAKKAQPALRKGLRDTIESRVRKNSESSNNDRDNRNRRKEEVPKRTV